jgi:hypothetical protein
MNGNIVSIVSTVGYVLKVLYNSLMNFGCRVNTEHQMFVPILAFSAKYIGDFATLAEPLRKLTRKEVKCQWKSEQ